MVHMFHTDIFYYGIIGKGYLAEKDFTWQQTIFKKS